jgi:hypothetical protein
LAASVAMSAAVTALLRARGRPDFVAQDEFGAGVAGADGGELVAERGQGLGAARRGERVEPDEQLTVAGRMSPEVLRASRMSA